MNSRSLQIAGLLSSALLVAAMGCGGRPSAEGSMTEATVRGTVTINGKPATTGEVVFDPSNYERPNAEAYRTPIQEDGSYEITTLVGYNMVQIDSEEAARADAAYSTIDYEVQQGENTFDIKLPPDQ